MFEEVIVCLDGSSLAEAILPLARAVSAKAGGKLTLLRVVGDAAELVAEEEYLRDCARQNAAQLNFVVSADPATAIAQEIKKNPQALAALTSHGRSAWSEAILGSVALRVLRECGQPVLVFCPLSKPGQAPKQIDSLVVALDGSPLAERIIPHAVNAAQSLAAGLILVQVLPVTSPMAALDPRQKADGHESSYLHGKAAAIKKLHGLDAQWEVLHGEPAEAICRYVSGLPHSLLAMTTHGRGAMERLILGSVAGLCLRHAAVPLLLYWPQLS